jgi:hypothetical protein
MLINGFQLEQTEKRFAERRPQRGCKARLVKEKRYLEVDSPERVQKFLARRELHVDLDQKPVIERASTMMAGETQGLAPDAAAFGTGFMASEAPLMN